MIEFAAVSRNYGQKKAVDHLDLVIPRGELFALLGPNGAGKTTTIKMLVGLLRPSSGNVRLCGHDLVEQTREAHRLLGYVPDQPILYDKLTGREFLHFVADMHGLEPSRAKQAIQREIDAFRLAEFADQLTESFSHGMKQRVVFAAALLHDPAVLVLDEPMVGLDPRSMRTVKDLLTARAAQGMTILMSTHTLNMAEEIAHRIGIFDQGQLRFVGTLPELRQQMSRQQTTLEQMYLELTADEQSGEPGLPSVFGGEPAAAADSEASAR